MDSNQFILNKKLNIYNKKKGMKEEKNIEKKKVLLLCINNVNKIKIDYSDQYFKLKWCDVNPIVSNKKHKKIIDSANNTIHRNRAIWYIAVQYVT